MYITFFDEKQLKRVTYKSEVVTPENLSWISTIEHLLDPLADEAIRLLTEGIEDKYWTYYKKKRNKSSKRRIDVPNEELKKFMRSVVYTITKKCNFLLPDYMYAYSEGKNTKQLAELHKNSDILLKYDIHSFFNSCSYEFIMQSMSEVYPFCLIKEEIICPIVMACTLNGTLPQGAPTSPLLSSIAMVPFVYNVNNRLKYLEKKWFFSIYADDIFISVNTYRWDKYWREKNIQTARKIIFSELRTTPLRLNTDKTRTVRMYKSGGTWVTGLMVNQKHQVTIGHEKKQILKATVFSFLADYKNGNIWSQEKVSSMDGKINYYRFIEPTYVDMIIQKYSDKVGVDYESAVKQILYF